MPSTTTITAFAELGVADDLCACLTQRGRTEPFPIQATAIPPAIAGNDVCGRAPTGSGKTLAFGLPIAQRVARARPGRPRALVLAPTRELAAQIGVELRPLLAVRKRSVATFYGGVGFGPQLKALRRGVDVAVGCPGRVADLVRRGVLFVEHGSAMVFCRTKRGADKVARQLAKAGVSAAAIHGDRSQAQRDRALAAFQTRRVEALVATDVAARGIHVDAVGCVVHFDIPADEKAYVHRSGRTGRAGAGGTVPSLVNQDTAGAVQAPQPPLGLPMPTSGPDPT